ncbi:MAG: preprotein translocase subunit SecG [Elusimicrobia bacterium]|nr:preprotein translocase subunit SecG [Elusimicrobiota bacterium]
MYTFIMILHIIICLILIISILVFQTSKGSALSMFGGGGENLFSAPSATGFIKKFTAWTALAFAVTSIMLTVLAPQTRFKSVVQENPLPIQTQQAQQQADTKTPVPQPSK